ncbi:anion permease [Microbispora triticiradicis]|uniref:Anion permease n=1 Tax=Microbispora triticiradicis TaxID=2200763 RepID=A0ABX9LEA6_9ACTN|nr:inorganic phosphate transporter [Microbispora triticiradicis]RGA02239.1 anion permease [Microbispora triticiradicis]GLW22549.1 phosphate transporter [Microbispora amethystogenes]
MEVLVLLLVLLLAAANGANDVPKGVATLAGAGVTKIRTAIAWGTVATALGCLVSLTLASKMTQLFSKGIVSATPTPAFTVAVLIGTIFWVVLATVLKLPVSTTHALVGSLLGAGSLFAGSSVEWSGLLGKVVQPLLLSILVAYAISAVLGIITRKVVTIRTARRERTPAPVPDGDAAPVGGRGATVTAQVEQTKAQKAIGIAHWATSGLASFARGLNDAPKIVAIGSFALVGGMTPTGLLFAVTAAMAVGGVVAGSRIADRLAYSVIKIPHVEGFTANLTTAGLVGLGAVLGLPMSTTQVSAGAISGIAANDLSRLNKKTVRDLLIAWLCTPPVAAAVAAGAYLLLS